MAASAKIPVSKGGAPGRRLSHWEWLCGGDVVEWARPLWDGGGWILCGDGKLRNPNPRMTIDTPWVHNGHHPENKCGWNHQIVFLAVSLRMPSLFAGAEVFVPRHCQDCWKVVARPRTVVELFAMEELQRRMGHPSKCGTEERKQVGALYGAYWYNRGKEAGLECFDRVRGAIDADPYLGPGVKVILKRACTEMEIACGPSDKWRVTPEQVVVEDLLEEFIDFQPITANHPPQVVIHTMREWIEFARKNGDETHLVLTDGRPIVPEYVTYQGQAKRLAGPKAGTVTYNPRNPDRILDRINETRVRGGAEPYPTM